MESSQSKILCLERDFGIKRKVRVRSIISIRRNSKFCHLNAGA